MKPFDQEYEQGEFFCFFAHQSVKQYFWGQNALNPNNKGETVKDKIKCGDKFLYIEICLFWTQVKMYKYLSLHFLTGKKVYQYD